MLKRVFISLFFSLIATSAAQATPTPSCQAPGTFAIDSLSSLTKTAGARGQTFFLTNNIELTSGADWQNSPLFMGSFLGTLDGCGHTVIFNFNQSPIPPAANFGGFTSTLSQSATLQNIHFTGILSCPPLARDNSQVLLCGGVVGINKGRLDHVTFGAVVSSALFSPASLFFDLDTTLEPSESNTQEGGLVAFNSETGVIAQSQIQDLDIQPSRNAIRAIGGMAGSNLGDIIDANVVLVNGIQDPSTPYPFAALSENQFVGGIVGVNGLEADPKFGRVMFASVSPTIDHTGAAQLRLQGQRVGCIAGVNYSGHALKDSTTGQWSYDAISHSQCAVSRDPQSGQALNRITLQAHTAGGLVGLNAANPDNTGRAILDGKYNSVDGVEVTSGDHPFMPGEVHEVTLGGAVGENQTGNTLQHFQQISDVTIQNTLAAPAALGGLVGYNQASIDNALVTNPQIANTPNDSTSREETNIGGLVGLQVQTTANDFIDKVAVARGMLATNFANAVGGLIGKFTSTSTLTTQHPIIQHSDSTINFVTTLSNPKAPQAAPAAQCAGLIAYVDNTNANRMDQVYYAGHLPPSLCKNTYGLFNDPSAQLSLLNGYYYLMDGNKPNGGSGIPIAANLVYHTSGYPNFDWGQVWDHPDANTKTLPALK